jgi:hypothetical protein
VQTPELHGMGRSDSSLLVIEPSPGAAAEPVAIVDSSGNIVSSGGEGGGSH